MFFLKSPIPELLLLIQKDPRTFALVQKEPRTFALKIWGEGHIKIIYHIIANEKRE